MAITTEERRLMLHALGLGADDKGGRKRWAFRNHFFTSESGPDRTNWRRLADRCFARIDSSCRPVGRFFQVTPEGMRELGPDIFKRIPRDMKEPIQ